MHYNIQWVQTANLVCLKNVYSLSRHIFGILIIFGAACSLLMLEGENELIKNQKLNLIIFNWKNYKGKQVQSRFRWFVKNGAGVQTFSPSGIK